MATKKGKKPLRRQMGGGVPPMMAPPPPAPARRAPARKAASKKSAPKGKGKSKGGKGKMPTFGGGLAGLGGTGAQGMMP